MERKWFAERAGWFACGLLLLLLTSCGRMTSMGISTIGEVTQSATSLEGKEVKLQGVARQVMKVPIVGGKLYRLADATGNLLVWTEGVMPAEGEEVVVRGRVEHLLILDGQGSGIHLKEIERLPVGPWWTAGRWLWQ